MKHPKEKSPKGFQLLFYLLLFNWVFEPKLHRNDNQKIEN